MGQKTNPIGFRLAVDRNWQSIWHNDKQYKQLLHEDLALRQYLKKRLKFAGVHEIVIKRSINQIDVLVQVAKPGIVIGRGGAGIEELKKDLDQRFKTKIRLTVEEFRRSHLSARLVAQMLVAQIERRYPYKRAVKQMIQKVRESGADGVKIEIAGRLAGARIARTEKRASGTVPVSTLSSSIEFAKETVLTKYGTVGLKVWIYCQKKEEE